MHAFVGLLFLAVAGFSVQSGSTGVALKTDRLVFTSGERESVAQNLSMAIRHCDLFYWRPAHRRQKAQL